MTMAIAGVDRRYPLVPSASPPAAACDGPGFIYGLRLLFPTALIILNPCAGGIFRKEGFRMDAAPTNPFNETEASQLL